MAEEKKSAGNPLWKPGVSGNKSGKSKTKLLTDALRMELVQNPGQARNIARKILALAEEGDLTAANIVFDRLEGKPTQAIEIDQTITNLTPEEIDQRIRELTARLGMIVDVTPQEVRPPQLATRAPADAE
jgi:hypothetical protein